MADTPDEAARKATAAASAQLIHSTISKRFDEKLGAKDWKRYFAEYMVCVASAGAVFVQTAIYTRNMPGPPEVTEAIILADDSTGAPVEPLHVLAAVAYGAC